MHRLTSVHCIVVISLISIMGFKVSAEEMAITINSTSPLIISENETTVVECKMLSTTNINLQWYYEDNRIVSTDAGKAEYQETINDTVVNLHISGQVDKRFVQTFKCMATNDTNFVISLTELEVQIDVKLTITPETSPVICQNDVAKLNCLVRSYPPPNVSWVGQGDLDTVEGIRITPSKEVEATLVVWGLTQSTNFTFIANNKNNETEEEVLEVIVRDDVPLNISFSSSPEDPTCFISWNRSTHNYTTGYQITVEIDGINTTIHENNKTDKSYSWMMNDGDDITQVYVALLMGECVGPAVKSEGSCSYQEPPTDNTDFIAVTATLGSIIVILLLVFGGYCYKIRVNTKEPSTHRSNPHRTGNKYETSMIQDDPQKSASTQDHVNPQPVYDNPPDENVYDMTLGDSNSDEYVTPNNARGQSHHESSGQSGDYETPRTRSPSSVVPTPSNQQGVYQNGPALPPRDER